MGPLKVLILDDEPCIRDVYQWILEDQLPGIVIRSTKNSDEALDGLEAFRPEVMITDMEHPGLGQSDFVKCVRQRWPLMPIVVASAVAEAPTIAAALQAGANEYIIKPVVISELMRTIKSLIS